MKKRTAVVMDSARGALTQEQFAKKISEDYPTTQSTLYRTRNAELKSVTLEYIKAIYNHRAPGCEYNLEDFIEAFQAENITILQRKRRNHSTFMENIAKGAILEMALESDAAISKAHTTVVDSNGKPLRIYDYALEITSDDITQTAYFEIKAYRAKVKASHIDMAIGQIMRESPSPSKYYYLVLVTAEENQSQIMSDLLEQLSGTRVPLNLSIVSIVVDREANYTSSEINLSPEKGLLSFNK